MTRWPTVVDSHVWTTPNTAVTTVTASMPPTASTSSRTSWWGSASSMTSRTRNGVARATVEDATISGHHDDELPAVGPEERGHPAPAHGGAVELGLVGRVGTAADRGRSVMSSMRHLLGSRMLRLPHGVVTAAALATIPR